MRAALVALTLLPAIIAAQETAKDDPARVRVSITGCVKGSTLTETNLHVSGAGNAPRRWRVRGAKSLMSRLKDQRGRELEVFGTMRRPLETGRRIGRTNIYIGGAPGAPARDPLPELPTLDVESFTLTGEKCR